MWNDSPERSRPSRRQFLEMAGAGLLVLAAEPRIEGQTGAGGAATLEARLHIGEDGSITILSGKVEEGQGSRTELAMAAAEELRVPLERVRVLMADTDLAPNDGITAGSRTTPGTVPGVRQAAAAARELLAAVAAREGAALEGGGRRQYTYADLAKSPELAKAYQDALPAGIAVTPAKDWRLLGTAHARVNGRDIVSGSHQYPSDIVRPDMLYGCVLRPPAYNATLVSVDLAAAQNVAGAKAVRDGAFVGSTAPTSYAARKAVEAMAKTAQWKTGEHPSSDGLFAYLKEHAQAAAAEPGAGGGGERGRGQGQTRGNPEQALAAATNVLAAEYRVPYVQHAPMEPRAAVAEWQDGKLTVWTGTSNPFGVRDQLAQAFGLKTDRVRVIVPDFGGGFGGKHTGEAALEAARLAREAGKPVKLRWTRVEEFTWAYFRPAALIEIQAALDGKTVVAWDFTNYNSGASAIDTPYRIPNARARFINCDAPPLRQGSYRCLAATANNFAREAFTDELAAAVGVDPLEFRLAHLENARLRDVLAAAATRFRWQERRRTARAAGRGIGLACGTEKNSVVAACVEVEVDRATGVPRLIEICQAFECGAMLNPLYVRSQVEGAIMMGLGAALREEMQFEGGRLKNGRFAAYRTPRFHDLPRMDILLVDRKDIEPAGAGETPIIAVAPAIANAVFDATGTRARSLPLRAAPVKT